MADPVAIIFGMPIWAMCVACVTGYTFVASRRERPTGRRLECVLLGMALGLIVCFALTLSAFGTLVKVLFE